MDSMDINAFVLVGSMVNSVKKRTEITTIPMSVRQVITTVMNMRHVLILPMGSSANVILDSTEMEKPIAWKLTNVKSDFTTAMLMLIA